MPSKGVGRTVDGSVVKGDGIGDAVFGREGVTIARALVVIAAKKVCDKSATTRADSLEGLKSDTEAGAFIVGGKEENGTDCDGGEGGYRIDADEARGEDGIKSVEAGSSGKVGQGRV